MTRGPAREGFILNAACRRAPHDWRSKGVESLARGGGGATTLSSWVETFLVVGPGLPETRVMGVLRGVEGQVPGKGKKYLGASRHYCEKNLAHGVRRGKSEHGRLTLSRFAMRWRRRHMYRRVR